MAEAGSRNRVGIDLGGTKIAGILLDAHGAMVSESRRTTPQQDYRATLAAIVELANQLDPSRMCPVGIGTPGSIIPGSGLMHNCNSVWLNGQPLLNDLNDRLLGRVRIANDADCFALSEAVDGSGADAESVFGVILGTGVGGGLVVDGRLVRGAGGLAGEWGHNPMPLERIAWPEEIRSRLPSRQCYCGQLNCVETYLSGSGLSATHAALWAGQSSLAADKNTAAVIYHQAVDAGPQALSVMLGKVLSTPDWRFLSSAETDTQRAQCSLAIYCTMLVSALTVVVNLLDPEVIVLGGGLSHMQAIYRPVEDALHTQAFGGRGATRLQTPRYGDASGVRGAAWLWDAPRSPG